MKRPQVEVTNLAKVDLRHITRDPDRCRTTVYLDLGGWDPDRKIEWLICGQTSIVSHPRSPGCYHFDARAGHGMTDFEESSAYALRLPLIGLTFDELAVHYHETRLVAWIDPNDPDFFRVPPPGYDPRKLPGATKCTTKGCEPKGHVIVPEGYWCPPHDGELYRKVAGKRVEIHIRPVYADDKP